MTTFLRFCDNPQLNVNATENNQDSHDVYLYKTLYYSGDDFTEGDYSKIKKIGNLFIDIVNLYSDMNLSDKAGTISWNDVLFKHPGKDNVIHANENINIILNDDQSASFIGGYISQDGYYKSGIPQRIELENHSLNTMDKDVFFGVEIEIVDNTKTRQVKLYKCKVH